ncbi:unnamed protein product, partial [Durusdinium trenchii]
MVLRLNKHLLWEVGLEASCLQGLWPLCRQVHGALLNFVENLTEISLQEAHCNFYLSELLACRTRGLARLQIGARSWDLASLEDGQHLILPSLSEREALMLSPQLRRMNHLKKITVGLKGPTIWWRTGTWELWSGPWWPGFFEKPARTRSGIVGQVAWR